MVTCYTCGLNGIDAYIVDIEADVTKALPQYDVVGLADMAIKESKERVRSGIKNSGFEFPARKITINLAPASVRKEGTHYDLPMAVALLGASVELAHLGEYVMMGELSLSGEIRGVSGVLPMADYAKKHGYSKVIVPLENAREAALVPNLQVYPVSDLKEVISFLKGETEIAPFEASETVSFDEIDWKLDFADVKGQENAKRALEVACSGGHSILMSGTPGSGKTMLSKRVPGILPPLTFEESMDVTKIYSVCSLVSKEHPMIVKRPFRALHHTASTVSIIGGGTKAMPGEISLAHNGVLFLDELPEFKREALEVLRQPLEDKKINVTRVSRSAEYPCNFMIIAAMNPCPCGYYGSHIKECSCTLDQIKKYQKKISGPLLDRIDIQIEVPSVNYDEIASLEKAESSQTIRDRVIRAREIQKMRYQGEGILTNAELTAPLVKKYCVLTQDAQNMMKQAFSVLGLTARGYDKIIKVARTIADLEESELIQMHHLAEAISYRDIENRMMY
ncbi:MAG: YifB family Mg chelatase-like AAA ATPase [Clostridia bacterium]|nr:YifB family Mg chelatase-like AAA ATPase [Clostridia bacterium]